MKTCIRNAYRHELHLLQAFRDGRLDFSQQTPSAVVHPQMLQPPIQLPAPVSTPMPGFQVNFSFPQIQTPHQGQFQHGSWSSQPVVGAGGAGMQFTTPYGQPMQITFGPFPHNPAPNQGRFHSGPWQSQPPVGAGGAGMQYAVPYGQPPPQAASGPFPHFPMALQGQYQFGVYGGASLMQHGARGTQQQMPQPPEIGNEGSSASRRDHHSSPSTQGQPSANRTAHGEDAFEEMADEDVLPSQQNISSTRERRDPPMPPSRESEHQPFPSRLGEHFGSREEFSREDNGDPIAGNPLDLELTVSTGQPDNKAQAENEEDALATAKTEPDLEEQSREDHCRGQQNLARSLSRRLQMYETARQKSVASSSEGWEMKGDEAEQREPSQKRPAPEHSPQQGAHRVKR